MTGQPAVVVPPSEPELPEGDPRTLLVQRVRSALMVLPGFFEFGTHFEGIDATDLFALNSVLGASIEGQVVRTLNKMRGEWDPYEQWAGYRFPWRLSNIMSGTPVASEPWVASARYAAELRNYWWEHVRRTSDPRGIRHPGGVQPYPSKDMNFNDVPEYDGGGNFGRLSRVAGLTTDFVAAATAQDALGIPIDHWINFLKLHSDNSDPEIVTASLLRELTANARARSEEDARQGAMSIETEQELLLQTPRRDLDRARRDSATWTEFACVAGRGHLAALAGQDHQLRHRPGPRPRLAKRPGCSC